MSIVKIEVEMNLSRIPVIFNPYRRNIGYIVRYSNPNAKKKYESPVEITKFIEKSARLHSESKNVDYETCKRLIDEMLVRINQFTVTEVRTIAYSITELFKEEDSKKVRKAIADFTLKRSYMMPICVLSPLINSVSKMGLKDLNFYNKVISVLIDRMDEANSIDLATIANTLVLLKNQNVVIDQDVIRSATSTISKMCMRDDIISEMSATNSVLIMYSFAKLNVVEWELFNRLLELIKNIDQENFEPHQIPLVLHVFSVFNIKKDTRLPFILECILKTANVMTYQNISSCLVSLARLNKRRFDIIKVLVENLKKHLPSIKIRELANVLWSLGKLSYNDPEFIDQCLSKILEYEDIDVLSYSQIFEAIKEYKLKKETNLMFNMSDCDLLDHLLKNYMKVMKSSPNQVITQVAWCCSVLNFDRYDVIKESLEELSKRKLNQVEQKYVNLLLERELKQK